MKEANRLTCGTGFPFEYANYPWTLANTYNQDIDPDDPVNVYDWCACAASEDCAFNPRKGRLRLSLAWLDEHVDLSDDAEKEAAIRLIQDAFTLMLLNARAEAWGQYQHPRIDTDGDGIADTYVYPVDSDQSGDIESDEYERRVWKHSFFLDVGPDFASIELAAASLTANLIDFADFEDDLNDGIDDNVPTRVELRSADFRDLATFGRGFDPPVYVYGIERQPFITEVVADFIDDVPPGNPDGVPDPPSYFGVELFNPYQDYEDPDEEEDVKGDIDLWDYALRIGGVKYPLKQARPFQRFLVPDEFLGYYGGDRPPGSADGKIRELPGLQFQDGTTIDLIRTLLDGTEVVVDQFEIPAATVGTPSPVSKPAGMERVVKNTDASRWHAPLPHYTFPVNHSFGGASDQLSLKLPPVEVKLANTGSLSTAFPTTGSLLLLMRYANYVDYAKPEESRAFTSYLNVDDFPIDNGRLPVFDLEREHHEDPAWDRSVFVDESGAAWLKTKDRAGSLMHLPWGQLVFDYFTALPLKNDGPFGEYLVEKSDDIPIESHWPRVDLDGLRVHGRINLNAAPWKVMEGLPFVPMKKIPIPFRQAFRDKLREVSLEDDPPDDDQPMHLGEPLAKAIVAYREQRELGGTGNYGDFVNSVGEHYGRSWTLENPTMRRGMGFLTVGELANVRHPDPEVAFSARFDVGETDFEDGDYLKAVAVPASLGDWVTVRSHVFTIYGTLRGDFDPQKVEDLGVGGLTEEEQARLAEDVDSRALRFQETMDRLPTFVGARTPVRIGKRVLTKYHDVRND
jgi:hypothetical protein